MIWIKVCVLGFENMLFLCLKLKTRQLLLALIHTNMK